MPSEVFSVGVLRDLVAIKAADGMIGSKDVQIALARGILQLGLAVERIERRLESIGKDVTPDEDIKVGGTD